MKYISLIALLAVLMLPTVPTTAQANACENGLPQRLEVGGRGWIDPTPPAQGVRMRQAPGQPEVARLEPGEQFTVLDGPQCFDGLSWWEIETDTGKLGWIAEGIPGGGADPEDDYFVQSLESIDALPVQNTNTTCGSPPDFELGQWVELTVPATNNTFFYGTPRIEGALFPFAAHFENPQDAEFHLDFMTAGFLTDGPVCINGSYMYEFRTPVELLWINSSDIRLMTSQPQHMPVYIPQSIVLSEPEAPIVSLQQQISFIGEGGGGGGPVWLINEPCRDVRNLTGLIGYRNECVSVYPLPLGETATVTVLQSDGIPIASYEAVSERFSISTRSSDGSVQSTFQTSGINAYVPTQLGVTEGVYLIRLETATQTIEHAYFFFPRYADEVFPDLTGSSNESLIGSFCENSEPIVVAANFEPNESIELVYIASDNGGYTEGNMFGDFDYDERYRWQIQLDEQGSVRAEIGLELPPDGLFVVADDDGNWQTNAPDFVNGGIDGPLAEPLARDCETIETLWPPLNLLGATAAPLDGVLLENQRYNNTLISPVTWTFSGNAGETISLNVSSENTDIQVAIQDASSNLLIEDDDSGSRTDARISQFTLPETGEYTVVISSWGDKPGNYTIILTRDDVGETASNVDLSATAVPTESPAQDSCPGAPESRLSVGDTANQATESDPIRVRAEPQSGTTIQYLLYPGQEVTIIGGPECNRLDDGSAFVWWQVRNADGLEGWVAEGTADNYFLAPGE